MTLLLDTSVLIDINSRNRHILEKMKGLVETDPAPAAISFINYFEFIHGLRMKPPKNREKAVAFIEKFYFLRPTKKTAIFLSDLKHKYEKLGKPVSLADLMTASQAIENNMTLVTTDKQFKEIEELKKIIL